jgi:hypothetical protein
MNNSSPDKKHNLDTPEMQEEIRLMNEGIELEEAKHYGPPEERKRKNREHVDKLVARYSEPVARSILKRLSQAGDYVFADLLRRHDLDETDLHDVILRYDLGGPRIDIRQGKDHRYKVVISGGWGNAGEEWKGVVWQEDGEWRFECTEYCVF